MGRGATVRLEIKDIVIRINLESCVGQLFCKEDGGLGDLCNPVQKCKVLDRERKQEMINSAVRCLSERRDIPSPAIVDGKIEGTHPDGPENFTETIKEYLPYRRNYILNNETIGGYLLYRSIVSYTPTLIFVKGLGWGRPQNL